jgi:hypothetical protein
MVVHVYKLVVGDIGGGVVHVINLVPTEPRTDEAARVVSLARIVVKPP